ncbi:MAG: C10 family peptidase [Bacteroidales bacterium]|nr:C10 family peptidase [Bacteroidales bacterium]
MKKRTFLPILMLVLGTGMAMAKDVDPAVARTAAMHLLQKDVVDATPDAFSECYLFVGADGQGFALIAADDCVRPVLGYSATGSFPTDGLPSHILGWIEAYELNIRTLRHLGITPSPQTQQEWQMLATSKFRTVRDTAVAPLLTTQWDQSPRYNQMCPYSTTDQAYSVTGCVATAMAQVMKYWNHPAVGRGSHSYSAPGFGQQSAQFDTTHYAWTHMPDRLNWNSTQQEIDAVAQLMYHVGIAVEMNYSPQSSGSHVSAYGDPTSASAENALKNYFRYNQALFSAYRGNYTDAQWNELLTIELNASRPVMLSGTDGQGGHAFIIDGYDSLGFYHLNWGWGGYCDGYYTFDSLSPGASGIGGNESNSYSHDNHALLHVFPASEDSLVTVSVVASDTALGTVSGGGTMPAYTSTTLLAIANEGHRFLNWKSGNHYNPFTFAPNNDHSDTALFAPIHGDTLGYCFSGYQGLWGEYGNNPPEWGIRVPARSVPDHRQLNAVQFYGVSNATYTLNVYLGNHREQLIFSATPSTSNFGWVTVPLSSPVPLVDSLPLWITLTSRSYSNPAVYSSYSGNPDGTWYKRAGSVWEHLEGRNEYYSWMIRALLGNLEKVVVSAEPNNADRGTVDGSGRYYPGDTALLTATPADGYRFAGWSTGETANPLPLRVTGPATIIAAFVPLPVGIDDPQTGALTFSLDGLSLTVRNPQGRELTLIDMQGRTLATLRSPAATLALPAAGVYMLQADGESHKIVAL